MMYFYALLMLLHFIYRLRNWRRENFRQNLNEMQNKIQIKLTAEMIYFMYAIINPSFKIMNLNLK